MANTITRTLKFARIVEMFLNAEGDVESKDYTVLASDVKELRKAGKNILVKEIVPVKMSISQADFVRYAQYLEPVEATNNEEGENE